jgi:hypothetical protein
MKKNIYDPAVEKPILNTCIQQTHDMLCKAWPDFAQVRDECGGKAKIGIRFTIDCEGISPIVNVKLGFSKKFENQTESTVDLGQEEFPFIREETK